MSRKSFYKQSAKVDATSTATVLEVEKPTKFIHSDQSIAAKPIYKSTWLWWIIVTGMSLVLVAIGCILVLTIWYCRSFETTAQTQILPLIKELWQKKDSNIYGINHHKTVLFLGVDQSQNQRENSILTDTMILMSIKEDGNITTIPLPRDLWIDSLKTKVNALYYYGQQTNPTDSMSLVTSVVGEITGIPIDYVVMVNMDTVKSVIDALKGVDITVERSFEDKLYPREIDVTSQDPAILYETIRFEAGPNHMDGATALKYIRSRHSEDEFEGTDEGRERRQQQVITAIKNQLLQPDTLTDPTMTGSLYHVWKTAVSSTLSDVDLMLLLKQFRSVSLTSTAIPVQTASSSGIIYHPLTTTSKQWVYLPIDPSWNELRQWIKEQL